MESVNAKQQALEKLAKLGFKKDKSLGMNILKQSEGETVLIKITSDVKEFQSKNGETYKYVTVDNLETGETDQTYWLSGQLVYTLKNQKDGFIGGLFAVTHLGQVKVDGQNVNQFDVIAISQ